VAIVLNTHCQQSSLSVHSRIETNLPSIPAPISSNFILTSENKTVKYTLTIVLISYAN